MSAAIARSVAALCGMVVVKIEIASIIGIRCEMIMMMKRNNHGQGD